MKNEHSGFIALLSVVIISTILLVVTTILSFSSFFTRFTVLESEYKARSKTTSEACLNIALLRIAKKITPEGTIHLSDVDTCTIQSVTTINNQKIIRIQSIFEDSYTNIEVAADSDTFSIISWKELEAI